MNNEIQIEIARMCNTIKLHQRVATVCGGMGIAKGVSNQEMKDEFAKHGFVYEKISGDDSAFTITLKGISDEEKKAILDKHAKFGSLYTKQ